MAERVTTEDLTWAAGWMLAYEGDDGVPAEHAEDSTDPFVLRCRRVAAWMDAEVARREREAAVRTVVRQAGLPVTAKSRAAARRALARELEAQEG